MALHFEQKAWPKGAQHLLVFAATSPDEDRAVAHFMEWLESNDLNDAGYNEHRLLSAIVERFATRLAHLPEYPRLTGLQRLNWTRSRMTVRDVLPAFQMMIAAGLTVVLLKGAGRVALDKSEQKSRASYDVDILLGEDEFVTAFDFLMAEGWQSNRGESEKSMRARMSSLRGRNFVKGKFGDIDLHRDAYHPQNRDRAADEALFRKLEPVQYFGLAMFVPCPEERMAMAIAHAGWSVDSHSDWLVDCGRIVQNDKLDWALFLDIVGRRHLRVDALIALSYLRQAIGLDIPEQVLASLKGRGIRQNFGTALGTVLRRESSDLNLPLKAVRLAVLAVQESRHPKRNKGTDAPRYLGRIGRAPAEIATKELRSVWPLPLVPEQGPGRYKFQIVVEANLPPARRRVEFDINSGENNLCSFFAMSLREKTRSVSMRFSGVIEVGPGDMMLEIEARPGKVVNGNEPPEFLNKYREVPFRVVRAQLTPLGATDGSPDKAAKQLGTVAK